MSICKTSIDVLRKGELMRLGITEPLLRRLYTDLGKTDSEISKFFDCDRTTIVKLREIHGIHSRKSIGEIGEDMLVKELKSRGYVVKNMNDKDKLYPYDLLVDSEIRIEVKSASIFEDGRFHFTLTEKPENKNIESETRIRLENGRTKKVFTKSCDLMVFVGVENEDCHFFLIKPTELSEKIQAVATPLDPFSKSKYNKFRERWEVIEQIKSLMRQHQTEKSII